jgi:hypothetical protein
VSNLTAMEKIEQGMSEFAKELKRQGFWNRVRKMPYIYVSKDLFKWVRKVPYTSKEVIKIKEFLLILSKEKGIYMNDSE